jgi:hypothetical protein
MAVNPTPTVRYEYLTMSYTYAYGSTTYEVNGEKEGRLKNRPLHDVLTLFGQAGWELVGIAGTEGKNFIFKRLGTRSVGLENDKQEK